MRICALLDQHAIYCPPDNQLASYQTVEELVHTGARLLSSSRSEVLEDELPFCSL